ncbi:hypothetical protein WISP_38309 [Willisornis vidua]|uniref:Uncharacterized protein n=1 Tax=Willisornis vidua TaxID=1566151 RepID=A0ABQ9DNZ7_9PASS|nr:hypothetical protein WISP_38309 [Willisornis vidua]
MAPWAADLNSYHSLTPILTTSIEQACCSFGSAKRPDLFVCALKRRTSGRMESIRSQMVKEKGWHKGYLHYLAQHKPPELGKLPHGLTAGSFSIAAVAVQEAGQMVLGAEKQNMEDSRRQELNGNDSHSINPIVCVFLMDNFTSLVFEVAPGGLRELQVLARTKRMVNGEALEQVAGEAVDVLSLEVYKARLDGTWSNLIQWKASMSMAGMLKLDDL